MNKIKPNKTWIIYGIVFAAFMCIGIFAGLHHEAWADEAQSWLIARDNDLIGIFNMHLAAQPVTSGSRAVSPLINKAETA